VRAITVRFEVVQQNGLEIEFDETFATDSVERALELAEEYRHVPPLPLAMAARVVADDLYENGRTYPRKNWCVTHQRPMPAHDVTSACRTQKLTEAMFASASASMLEEDARRRARRS